MQEIFFTILIIWILFRLFNSSSVGSKRTVNFTQNNFDHKETPKEGETKITYNPNSKSKKQNEDGYYVDFEDMPTDR